MAATLHMQAPHHRPSMDRAGSFERPLPRSSSASYDRSPSPALRTHSRQNSTPSVHSPSYTLPPATGSSSPYGAPQPQPAYNNSYFPPPTNPIYSIAPPHAWSTTALPATSFYAAPFASAVGFGAGGSPGHVFHPGFQQSHPDFPAWANAYQHMMMAGMAAGAGVNNRQPNMVSTPPQRSEFTEFVAEPRRRTSSGPPQTYGTSGGNSGISNSRSQQFDGSAAANSTASSRSYGGTISPSSSGNSIAASSNTAPSSNSISGGANQAYHPYKRGPSHRPSRENISVSRSVSQSSLAAALERPSSASSRPIPHSQTQYFEQHRKSSSVDSTNRAPLATVQAGQAPQTPSKDDDLPPPPTLGEQERRGSFSSQRSGKADSARERSPSQSPAPANRNPAPSPSQTASNTGSASLTQTVRVTTPLTSSSLANAAAAPAPRPSPLSQATSAQSPEPTGKMVKSNGLKGRLRRALDKDKDTKKEAARSTPSPSQSQRTLPSVVANPPVPPKVSTATSAPSPPSASSSATASPVTNPSLDFAPPSAPYVNMVAMGSEVSLAATERTEATTTAAPSELGGAGGTTKSKRGLFRMKNMSTDNISLSSTVSSASMMIRKMGSIGKLAKRNSLMGISKIFKDKPKDEDAALPEVPRDGGKRKNKKGSALVSGGFKKSEASPALVSFTHAETDRTSEEEDRALAGLSPAAKLARQHTLRSKAEAARKERETAANNARGSEANGEPAWDNSASLAARRDHAAPAPIQAVASRAANNNTGTGRTAIVRVEAVRSPTVVHAVAVTEHEYDSAEDSSDGETVDDVAFGLSNTRIEDGDGVGTPSRTEEDEDFVTTWGNAYIDPNAVPRKGILKNVTSFESLEKAAAFRPRSNSVTVSTGTASPGPLAGYPPLSPDQIDGLSPPSPNRPSTPPHQVSSPLDHDAYDPLSPNFSPFENLTPVSAELETKINLPFGSSLFNSSAPSLTLDIPGSLGGLGGEGSDGEEVHGLGVGLGKAGNGFGNGNVGGKQVPTRVMTVPNARRLAWAPECAVYRTYDAGTYDRRSEPATCNRLTPELAMQIKQELNAFKLEMPVHPSSRGYTHYFS